MERDCPRKLVKCPRGVKISEWSEGIEGFSELRKESPSEVRIFPHARPSRPFSARAETAATTANTVAIVAHKKIATTHTQYFEPAATDNKKIVKPFLFKRMSALLGPHRSLKDFPKREKNF